MKKTLERNELGTKATEGIFPPRGLTGIDVQPLDLFMANWMRSGWEESVQTHVEMKVGQFREGE